MLRFQTIVVPFGQGLAQQIAPNLVPPGKLLQAHNAIIDRQGSIEKRPGSTNIPLDTYVFGGGAGAIGRVFRLTSSGRETLLSSGERLYSYFEESETWRDLDHAYEATVEDRILGERSKQAIGTEADVVYCNGWYAYAWLDPTTPGRICVRFVDKDTRAKSIQFSWAIAAPTHYRIRLLAQGTKVHCLWYNHTGHQAITATTWDTTNLETAPVDTDVCTSVDGTNPVFEATATATHIYVAFNIDLGLGVTGVAVTRRDANLANPATVAAGDESSRCIGISAETGGIIFVAYTDLIATSQGVCFTSINETTMAVITGPVSVDTNIYDGVGTKVVRLGVCHWGTIAYLVFELESSVWTQHATRVWVVNSIGDIGYAGETNHVGMLSKPILWGGEPYIVGYYHASGNGHITQDDGQRFGYLLHLRVGPVEEGERRIIDAQARVVARVATWLIGYSDQGLPSNLALADTANRYAVALPMKSDTQDGQDEGFDVFLLRFLEPRMHLPSEIQGEALFAGGVPAQYDTSRCQEYGFHFAPVISTVLTAHTEGALTPSSTYRWCAVYVHLDNHGVQHRSAPSLPGTCTLAAGEDGAAGEVQCLSLTERYDPENEGALVQIEIYRTLADQEEPFYWEQTIDNVKWEAYLDFSSTASDATIQQNAQLYTNGDVLENWQPPAARFVVQHNQRLWLISADDPRQIWISKINFSASEMPGFSLELVARTELGGDCVALASLDDKLIVFKQESIYCYVGDPPNDQLQGGDVVGPRLITVQTGCIEPRSVVVVPSGVVFLARDGLWLLTRGLEAVKIGDPVSDLLRPYGGIATPVPAAATHLNFDGVNDNVLVAHDATLDFEYTDDFSIGVWLKKSGPGQYNFYSKAAANGIIASVHSGGAVRIYLYDAGGEIVVASTTLVNDGQWHHVVITWAGAAVPVAADVSIYIDGELETPVVLVDTLTASIQNATNITWSWSGDIGHMSVWGATLSWTQVSALFARGREDREALFSPVSDWVITSFEVYPTIKDYGSGGNDGTMTNMDAGDLVVGALDPEPVYSRITSAVHDEAREVVLFTLADETEAAYGRILVWHYMPNEWTVWQIPGIRSMADCPATCAAMLPRDGVPRYHIGQYETALVHLDPTKWVDHDGSHPTLTVSSAWLSFAGLQGFKKLRHISLLGTFRAEHSLTVKAFYDHDDTVWDTYSFSVADINACLRGTREQVNISMRTRRCESVRIEVSATSLTESSGADVRWESLTLELGGQKGLFRLPLEARK